jgi:hypothetical protein
MRLSALSKKRRRGMSYDGDVDVQLPNLTDNDIESSFRRVHVIPFQGDPLEALVKIGQRCRDLMVKFSFGYPSSHQSLSSPAFSDSFSSIISDLEEIHNSGISPLLELSVRQGSTVKRQIFETYLMKTATILENAPLGSWFSHISVLKLVKWLLKPANISVHIQDNGYGDYNSTNHPLLGTKYWKYNQSDPPQFLCPKSIHTLNFHNYPVSSRQEVKLGFPHRHVAHGQPGLTYGKEREHIRWQCVATYSGEIQSRHSFTSLRCPRCIPTSTPQGVCIYNTGYI